MKLFTASRAVGLAGLIVALVGSRLVAQDITVIGPAWFEPEKPGADVLPQFKKKPSPDYPPEMKKDQPGYLIVAWMVDETGAHIRGRSWASHPYFKEDVVPHNGLKFTAATKNGEPVGSVVWGAMIFNPKGASEKGADAIPRLLAVAPVVVSKETLAKASDTKDGQVTVWAAVKIDANGAPRVQTFEEARHEALREVIEKALLLSWKFAPARSQGQAVEADMRLGFWVTRAPRPTLGVNKADKMPQVISRAPPEFPRQMRQLSQQGEVVLEFVVDEAGAVKDVAVVRSDHPAFDEPALEALQKWKFKPGSAKGKPVSVKMRVPIVFNLEGVGRDRGVIQMPEQSKKMAANLPEELRYDVPPKPKGVLYPIYPFEQLMAKSGGKAEVAFVVGTNGRVTDVKVTKADQPEFGEALSAAITAFEFVPALKDGKPTHALFRMEHEFDARGWNGRPSSDDLDMLTLLRKHPERIVDAKALDVPIKPTSRRAPIFPSTVPANSGEALIEVLIDKEGHARLPKILNASAPAFGYAAAQAAGEWRFEVPKVAGKAVIVRVRVPFTFTRTSPGKKPAASAAEATTAPSAPAAQ
jgi:TonB family protein